jgi:putative ABC transport system permease protein
MSMLDALRYRLRVILRPDDHGREMTNELAHHLELETIDQLRSDPHRDAAAARMRAARSIPRRAYLNEERRAAAGALAMDNLRRDLRYGLGALRRRPLFAASAIGTIALGVAAVATAFTLIDSVFLRPLPVAGGDRLVRIFYPRPNGRAWSLGLDAVRVLRQRATAFDAVVAHESRNVVQVGIGDRSVEQHAAFVSANYWTTLGVHPRLGRVFGAAEDSVIDRDAVAVVSSTFWHAQLLDDPAVLGKEIRVGGRDFAIVGVAPEGFEGIAVGEMPNDIWLPLAMARASRMDCVGQPHCRVGDALARLAPGASLQAARMQLRSLEAALSAASFAGDSVRPLGLERAGGLRMSERASYIGLTRMLAAIAILVLVIACANLSGLLVARGVARQREMAVRVSLGAGRGRLVRQLLTESFIIAAAGGALGLLLSVWTTRGLMGFFASDDEGFHHFFNLQLDGRILALALLVVGVATLLFGVLPALTASRVDPAGALQATRSGGAGDGRARSLLVAAQVALAVVLLTTGSLLVRSARRLMHAQVFNADRAVVFRWRPDLAGYDTARFAPGVREIVNRLRTLPEVESVGFRRCCDLLWAAGQHGGTPIGLAALDTAALSDAQFVSSKFFSTLQVPVLAGREFTDADRSGTARVGMVNLPLAQRVFGSAITPAAVVGRVIRIDSVSVQIVGVVPDYQPRGVSAPPSLVAYVPYWQTLAGSDGDTRFAARVRGDPQRALPVITRAVAAIDPRVLVTEAMSMSSQVGARYVQIQLGEAVVIAAAGLALFLCATGLYGMIAFLVACRTREIGIRMALGATGSRIVVMFVGHGVRSAAIGGAVGLGVAFLSTGLVRQWLVGVAPRDAISFVTAAAVVLGATVIASWLPARQASRTDPASSLREG